VFWAASGVGVLAWLALWRAQRAQQGQLDPSATSR